MKVTLKKETNIIDVSDAGVANLLEITPDGNYFKYEVNYRVDPRRALQNSAITVNIIATSKPLTRESVKIFTGYNPDQLIKNIQQKSSLTKDQARSQVQNVFFSFISDISARIPNNKTGLLKKNPSIGDLLIPNIILSTEKTLKLKTVADATNENLSLPVLENNISTALVPTTTRNPVTSKTTLSNFANQRNIDPAQISGGRTNTIQSAKKVSGGISSMPTQNIRQYNLTENERVAFFGNLVNSNNPNGQLQLQGTDLMNVLVNQPRTTIDIKEILNIPIGFLQMDEFFLVLQLVDKTGIEVQTINITVPHSKNLAALQIPVVPPLVQILQTGLPGKNVINVKQLDKNAVGCALYRKELRKDTPVTDASFTFIGNISAQSSQDFQRIEDVVNNYNPILYRAIPYNNANVLAAEFGSAGSAAVKMSGKTKYNKRRNFISILGEVVDGAIYLELRDLPPGIIQVTLLKRDLTLNEKEFVVTTKPKFITNEESLAPLFITDNEVKKNRIYEYQVDMMYLDGDVERSSTNLIIKYNPVTANIVNTTISKPVVVQNGTELDTTFTLASSLIPGSLDQVKEALSNQGLLEYFTDDIYNERENLQNIIAYGILRHNLTTGETEDFGTIISPNFSDKTVGAVKGVKPLEGGSEYKYSVTTFFRAAETTLGTLERIVQTGVNRSYTFKPSKWLHPVTLNEGNLVSKNSLKRNHSQTTFTFGSVGNIETVSISLADILPSIIEAKAQRLTKSSTMVQWRIEGNVNKIDHFIIILEMIGGMRTVVGKSHNISDTNFFQFVDILDDNEHGKLTYYIVPVFYDYSRGTESATNEVLV